MSSLSTAVWKACSNLAQSPDAPQPEAVEGEVDSALLDARAARPAGTNSIIRGPRTLEAELALNPFLKVTTNATGQTFLDYQYLSTNTPVAPTRPLIEIEAEGAVGRNGQYTVHFAANLNAEDAVVIALPDRQILQGHVVALSVSDDQGHRVWLGELKDCEGGVPDAHPEQVHYRDAFAGIGADVVFTYGFNFLEQDVVLREQPALPPEIDEATARLEVWSEFVQAPEPRRDVQRVTIREGTDGAPGEKSVVGEDETLDFGSMRLAAGRAFLTGASDLGAGGRRNAVPVVKRWHREADRAFLQESTDYFSLKPALETLRRRQAQARSVTSVTNLARLSLRQGSGGSVRPRPQPLKTWLASQSSPREPGLVIDYRLVTTSLLNINFGTPTRVGPAAAGSTSTDYWTSFATPGSTSGTLNNLEWSIGPGRPSPVQLVLENAPGWWGNSTGDLMMDSYGYPWDGGNVTVRLNYIPAGTYDFYIYGAWGGVGQVNGNYVLSVGGTPQGQRVTILGANWAARNWTEGEHYVLYPNIAVGSGQQVAIVASPGATAAVINGIQMVASGSVNTPPTISDIPNQTLPKDTAATMNFTVGDAETPASALTVTASCANPALVPNSNLGLGGSGANRTLTVTPASGQIGTTTITVTVADGLAQASDTFVLTVTDSTTYVEVSKSGMLADASTTGWGWIPANAINGLLTDPGWCNEEGRTPGTDWLRLNLGSTRPVARVKYHPRAGAYNGTFLGYEIYVTDSTSTNMSNWGTPVATGTWTWPYGAETKTVDFATKSGRYVIFRCLKGANYDRYASANEVWVYELAGGGTVATPVIGYTGGVGSALVTLSTSTPGATLRYTLDGSEPTASSNPYNPPLTVTQTTTVKAKAFKAGMTDSATATAVIPVKVVAPGIVPNGGTFVGSVNVTLSTSTGGATLRYTTDGSEPTATSNPYNPPLTVIQNTTVKAKAFKSGMADSDTTSATFTVKALAPLISPNGGTFVGSVNVTLSTSTVGATLRYTTDGNEPTATSATYTPPLVVIQTTTLKAKAFKSGMADSDPTSATFTANGDPDKLRVEFPNLRVNTQQVTGAVVGDLSAYMAWMVGAANFAAANWVTCEPNLTVNLGAGDAPKDVWVGFKNLSGTQYWRRTRIVLDTTPPLLTVTGNLTVSQPVIQVTGTAGEPLSGITYDLANSATTLTGEAGVVVDQDYDTNAFEPTTCTFQLFDVELAPGANTLTLHAVDQAGNPTTITRTYTLDLAGDHIAPAITLHWPKNGAKLANQTFDVRGQLDDACAKVTVSGLTTEPIEGIVERDGQFWVEGSALSGSSGTLTVTATDAAGNTSTANLAVTRGTTTLTIAEPSEADLGLSRILVSGTVNNLLHAVWVNGVRATVYPTPNANGGYDWQAAGVPLGTGGTAVIQARAVPLSSNNGNGTGTESGPGAQQNRTDSDQTDVELQRERPARLIVEKYSEQWSLDIDRVSSTRHEDAKMFVRRGEGGYRETYTVDSVEGVNRTTRCDWPGMDEDGRAIGCSCAPEGYDPVPWERCSVGDSRPEGSGRSTYQRNARTVVKLQTGGKARSQGRNLFSLQAAAYRFLDTRERPPLPTSNQGEWRTVPVPATSVRVCGGPLGADGIRYVALPDNTTVDLTPTAPADHFTFTVNQTKHILVLTANGHALDRETPTFCVGEKVTFAAQLVPGLAADALTGSSPLWVIPDTFVNEEWRRSQYYGSPNYRINGVLLTHWDTSCWFVDGLGGRAAFGVLLDFSNGQHAMPKMGGSLRLYKPTFRLADIQAGVLHARKFGGLCQVKLGAFGETEAEGLTFFVEVKTAFSGDAGLTQLCQLDYSWVGASFTDWRLDNKFPYTFNHIRAGSDFADSFAFGDYPFVPSGGRLKANFRQYFQFRPDGTGSIWVTVGRADWLVHGEIRDTGFGTEDWEWVTRNHHHSGSITPSAEFPDWEEEYSNIGSE